MKKIKQKGFTLIELLVVMAIIGILVLIASPMFKGYTERTNKVRVLNNIKVAEKATEEYYLKTGEFPRSYEEGVISYTAAQLEEYVDEFYAVTGEEVILDPTGKYYDLDFDKLSRYMQTPKDGFKYIVQNPVGDIYYAHELTDKGKELNKFSPGKEVVITNVKPQAVITINPEGLIDASTEVTFTSEGSTDEDGDELTSFWSIDGGEETQTPPNGTFEVGNHTIILRVYDGKEYSEIVSQQFAVLPEAVSFSKTFGGSSDDRAYSIQQTSDGGYIVAGYSASSDGDVPSNKGSYDYWILKLDSSGNKVWSKTFGGSGNDVTYSIQQTSDGGYIVAGYTNSSNGDVTSNNGSNDYLILKLNSSGNKVWSKTFGGSSNDYARSIQQTSDGGYIVAGYSDSSDGDVPSNKGSADYWILKLNSSGNKVWSKTFGGSGNDIIQSIQQTSDGGYIISGYSNSSNYDVPSNKGSSDYWILKLDSSGNKVWSKTFGGSSSDIVSSIKQTSDGGYIVAGYTGSSNGDIPSNKGSNDAWILKLDSSGNKVWSKTFGGSGNDYARSIQQTSDGGYIVAGYSSSSDRDVPSNKGGWDYWILKLDADGNILWNKTFGGSVSDVANSIQQTSDGGYIVAGNSSSSNGDVTSNKGSVDAWILKLNSDGLIE